jgi:DNA-binding MarR family transcriptional regulator
MTNPMPLPLDQQLCFALYRAHLAVNRSYKPMLDEMGITYPQYLVLNVLGEADGRSIGAIAARLSLEPSTITPAVKRMEQAGLLRRARSPRDDRQLEISLTDAGRNLLSRSRCLGESLLDQCGLDMPGLADLNRQVQNLTAALDTARRDDPTG